jgi:hypothetical protein
MRLPGAVKKGCGRTFCNQGLYYINPKELQVDLLEIGVNQVSLQGKTGGEVITKGQIGDAERGDGRLAEAGAGRSEGKADGLSGAATGAGVEKLMPPVLTAVLAACRKNAPGKPGRSSGCSRRRPSPCHRRISATC